MLQNQEEITTRVINTLNHLTLSDYDYLKNQYFKKLVKKYSAAIQRDIRTSLKQDKQFSSPITKTKILEVFQKDTLNIHSNLKSLIKDLTIRAMTAYGVCGKRNLADYVSHIEFTLVKSLIAKKFDKEHIWDKAITVKNPKKVTFASNRYGFKLLFND